jgi:HEAT repeat protein
MRKLTIAIGIAMFALSVGKTEAIAIRSLNGPLEKTDRQALISALLNERDSAAQSKASLSLIPYAGDPDIRAAFIKVFKDSKNDLTRSNAARALSMCCGGDKDIQTLLAKDLQQDKYNVVRSVIVSHLGAYLDNPDVLKAWIRAAKFDRDIYVRRKACADLATKVDLEEVYSVLVQLAENDPNPLMRGYALDALSSKITSRPELVPIYIEYLDNKSASVRYYAVKGLLKLNAPSLHSKLVEVSVGIIDWAIRDKSNWDDRLVLKGILLLGDLDQQEMQKAVNRLRSLGPGMDR